MLGLSQQPTESVIDSCAFDIAVINSNVNRTKYFFIMANFSSFSQTASEKLRYIQRKWTATCVNSKASPNACTNTQMSSPLDIGCPLCLVCTFVELAILRVSRHFPCNLPTMSLPRKACANIVNNSFPYAFNRNKSAWTTLLEILL